MTMPPELQDYLERMALWTDTTPGSLPRAYVPAGAPWQITDRTDRMYELSFGNGKRVMVYAWDYEALVRLWHAERAHES